MSWIAFVTVLGAEVDAYEVVMIAGLALLMEFEGRNPGKEGGKGDTCGMNNVKVLQDDISRFVC